jgi:hypothetical protein
MRQKYKKNTLVYIVTIIKDNYFINRHLQTILLVFKIKFHLYPK